MQQEVSPTEISTHVTSKTLSLPEAMPARTGARWSAWFTLCTLAFAACMLFCITPLVRMPDSTLTLHIALGSLVSAPSSWLPATFRHIHPHSLNSLEFFGLITLAFLVYGLGLLLVMRLSAQGRQTFWRGCIWCGTLLVGAGLLFTPALLSHDMMVYAGYGRLLAFYHVNPYFVPISQFPHDALTPFNDWSQSTSAYGPLWILICSFWGLFLKDNPTSYALAFRGFAFAVSLGNIWLIGRTLKAAGRSPRAVTLGMLLYAWNPLILLESSLDGHNDVFMMFFVLLGMLLTARANQREQLLGPRGYLPPVVVFTLAILVKFTALPVLAAYLFFLACKVLRAQAQTDGSSTLRQALKGWYRLIPVFCWSGLVSVLVVLAFYGPFWLGQSLRAVVHSFTTVPSSTGAKHSFFEAVKTWLGIYPASAQPAWLTFMNSRKVWDDLSYLALLLCLLLSARTLWRKPTPTNLRTLALAMLCSVLLITPWFYPWYITWPVALAAIALPRREQRTALALLALALVFSYTALSFYLIGFFGNHMYFWPLLNTLPPVGAALLCWFAHPALLAKQQANRSAPVSSELA